MVKKIALACEDDRGLEGEMSHHFGRCPFYTMAYADGKKIEKVEIVANPHFAQHQPGVMPQFIKQQGANVIIAGGMGPMAINMFNDFGIEVVTGVGGNVGRVLEAFLNGEISGAAPCAHDHDHGSGGCGPHDH